ncbi:MAG: response regulator [Clostridia bacterium]|nr:response regulator [Clostridia bacterium]
MPLVNVLIIDDDPLIAVAIEKLIKWEENNLRLVATFRNAEKALDMIRDSDVDIVITDIKMPVMDGLTFIKLAKKIKPELQFIVISEFDEYTLVNTAYQLGACNYLLKMELKAELLLESLLNAAKSAEKNQINIIKNNEDAIDIAAIEQKLFENKMVLKEKLLKEYVWGNADKALNDKLAAEGIIISLKDLAVLVVEFKRYYVTETNMYKGNRELMKFAILNVMEEVASKYPKVYCFCSFPDEYAILFHGENKVDLLSSLYEYFAELQAAIKKCFGMTIRGGYSVADGGRYTCKNLYNQAQSAICYSFFRDTGHLVSYDDVLKDGHNADFDKEIKIKYLKDALKAEDGSSLIEWLPKLKVSMSKQSVNNVREIRRLFDIYHYELLNYSKNNNCYLLVSEILDSYEQDIGENGNLIELNQWITDAINKIAECMGDGGIANKAKTFIKMHYGEPIKLLDVAEYVQISKGHLSRVFKKSIGISFTDYLVKVRMEEAIHFMKNTNLKVYEIAERVGYSSSAQFGRVFKKFAGKSPKDYMK